MTWGGRALVMRYATATWCRVGRCRPLARRPVSPSMGMSGRRYGPFQVAKLRKAVTLGKGALADPKASTKVIEVPFTAQARWCLSICDSLASWIPRPFSRC